MFNMYFGSQNMALYLLRISKPNDGNAARQNLFAEPDSISLTLTGLAPCLAPFS
jgi:hypothetical protein